MFKLESYITPIILNHVAKYVKNIRPQDSQVSLWEGEVAFQNLDLRLDVLEEELQLPFEFLSGHIHELTIHVPWTKITWEPINVTINTIEFVLKLKDQNTASGPVKHEQKKKISKVEESQQGGYIPSLVNKIINNITINCHNIILKYVEDDIVVSMNIQLLSFSSADEKWQSAFTDVNLVKMILRKLIQVSDLTICLDKRNEMGQIEVCQEPILYKCSLEIRILRKSNAATAAISSTTMIHLFSKALDINISSLQFPMVMRLVTLIMALKSGDIKSSHDLEVLSENGGDENESVSNPDQSYLSWAWNMLPNILTTEDAIEETECSEGHFMDVGMYIEELKFTLKHSELISESIVQTTKKIRYNPILRIVLKGLFAETLISNPKWFGTQAGINSIIIEPLGNIQNENSSSFILTNTEWTNSFLTDSLFDEMSAENCRHCKKYITDFDNHIDKFNPSYLIYRGSCVAFDMVHNVDETFINSTDTETKKQFEKYVIRLFLSSTTLNVNATLYSMIDVLKELIATYNYPPYVAEKVSDQQIPLKLPPPSMDEYDALMTSDIPKRIIEITLTNLIINIQSKDIPTKSKSIYGGKTLSISQKRMLPYIAVSLDKVVATWETPIDPNPLVFITCQLPEKPHELLSSCYDNYIVTVKNICVGIGSSIGLECILKIPFARIDFCAIIQPDLWTNKDDIKYKLDTKIDSIIMSFNRPQLIICSYLLNTLTDYNYDQLREIVGSTAKKDMHDKMLPKIEHSLSIINLSARKYLDVLCSTGTIKYAQSCIFITKKNMDSVKSFLFRAPVDVPLSIDKLFCNFYVQIPNDIENENLHSIMAGNISDSVLILDPALIEFLSYEDVIIDNNLYQVLASSTSIDLRTEKPSTVGKATSLPADRSRKAVQPEETIHLSSEKEEKIEVKPEESYLKTAEESLSFSQNLLKNIIFNLEIDQGSIYIPTESEFLTTITSMATNLANNVINYLAIKLPLVKMKSAISETLENLLNIKCPKQLQIDSKRNTFPWTCDFINMDISTNINNRKEILLYPFKTSISTAMNNKKSDIMAFNIHVDTAPVHAELSGHQVQFTLERVNFLMSIVKLMSQWSRKENVCTLNTVNILTSEDDDADLKEFLAMKTESERSLIRQKPSKKDISIGGITYWLQWTIEKLTLDILGNLSSPKKLRFEIEDFITSIDKQIEYFKLKSKIGTISLHYFELKNNDDWILNDSIKITVLSEISKQNETFFDLTITQAETVSVFNKLGAQKSAQNLHKSLTEIVANIKAINILLDLKALQYFIPLLHTFDTEEKIENPTTISSSSWSPLSVADMPLLYLQSNGITVYIPTDNKNCLYDVFIFKIGDIKISPNVENPLNRITIRADVYNKAAQLRMLHVPGSKIEDRQYELVFSDISAATGNWKEILSFLNKENVENFQNTNPAVEWNNQQGLKPTLELREIFSDFIISITYAPCIVYNNVLISGQAIELNCVTDLVVTLTNEQITLFLKILTLLESFQSTQTPTKTSKTSITSDKKSTINIHQKASELDGKEQEQNFELNSKLTENIKKSNSNSGGSESNRKRSCTNISKKESEKSIVVAEISDYANTSVVYPDSGIGMISVNAIGRENSCHCDIETQSETVNQKQIPSEISFVAGVFIFKFCYHYANQKCIITPDSDSEKVRERSIHPLLFCTLNQPSMIISQKYYENFTQFSLFNISVTLNRSETMTETRNKPLIETEPGPETLTGITPPLLLVKFNQSIFKKLTIECSLLKPTVINISHLMLENLFNILLKIEEAILSVPVTDNKPKKILTRGTKINKIQKNLFNANVINFSIGNIIIKAEERYFIHLPINNLSLNVNFYDRPEQMIINTTCGSISIKISEKTILHPVNIVACIKMTQENWYKEPIIIGKIKVNVIQVDVGPQSINNYLKALQLYQQTLDTFDKEWENLLAKSLHYNIEEETEVDRSKLQSVDIPKPVQNKKCSKIKEEFYQDDLRAGAFQFILVDSDCDLPMAYQIQIILKNNGIICWRYPQPRSVTNLQIYPIPMETNKPLQIRCRMEYYSEAHENFLYFCDFHISETETNCVDISKRKISANIWRVVILQSFIIVDGQCFECACSSDEDEELTSIKIDDILKSNKGETDFRLNPKALVACMRVDTTFNPVIVPKIQAVIDFNLIQFNMQNQLETEVDMPSCLKRYKLAKSILDCHTFSILTLSNLKLYGSMLSETEYSGDVEFTLSNKVLDYSYLNMLYLLEEMNFKMQIDFSDEAEINTTIDTIKLNIGPTILQTLIVSKDHWERSMNPSAEKYPILSRYMVCNETNINLTFGQVDTKEKQIIKPQEICMYCFQNDICDQKLVFGLFLVGEVFIRSDPICVDDEGIQYVRIAEYILIVQVKKVSATQICIYIRGQVYVISMASDSFRIQLHYQNNAEKLPDMDAIIERNDTKTFCAKVLKDTELCLRLKFNDTEKKGWTGDIPLRVNKNLPWLVKVPQKSTNSHFSFWVRVLKEDLPSVSTDNFKPQQILVIIWPMFMIRSMLSSYVEAEETTTNTGIVLKGHGETVDLNVPANHKSEHQIVFRDNFVSPHGENKTEAKLTFKTIDWNKFFYYDEKHWTIENAIEELNKGNTINWPKSNEEELRITRRTPSNEKITPIYRCLPSQDFSCALMLDISTWAFFINSLGITIQIRNFSNQNDIIELNSNYISSLFAIEDAFIICIPHDRNWLYSDPIYIFKSRPCEDIGKFNEYLITETGQTIITFKYGNYLSKFLLSSSIENGYRVFTLSSKHVITNSSKYSIRVFPFCIAENESIKRSTMSTTTLDQYLTISPGSSNTGISLDKFYDFNAFFKPRTILTEYSFYVCLKLENSQDDSFPIPLNKALNRKCITLQCGKEAISLAACVIEHNGKCYLNIYDDPYPAVNIINNTKLTFFIAQVESLDCSKETQVISDNDNRKFSNWYHILRPTSQTFYTPPEMYKTFPDIEPHFAKLALAIVSDNEDPFSNEDNILWSKPIRTDISTKKYFSVPFHGDVKVVVCDKHKTVRISIFYTKHKTVFCVKDLRSRLTNTSAGTNALLFPNDITKKLEKENDSNESSNLIDNQKRRKPSKDETNNDNYALIESEIIKSECIHRRGAASEDETRRIFNISLFIKEIHLNIFVDSKERRCLKTEVISFYIDDLIFQFYGAIRQLEIIISNLQIDNQLFSTGNYDFPVIICSEEPYKRLPVMPIVHNLLNEIEKSYKKNPLILIRIKFYDDEFKMESIRFRMNPIRAYIEDTYLNDLFDHLIECHSHSMYCIEEEVHRIELPEGVVLLPKDVVNQMLYLTEPLMLKSIRIDSMSILISVHTCVRLYIALDHSPLEFSSYEKTNIVTLPMKFGHALGMHYLSGALFGAGWVVGSLEILGSPSGLARSVSIGLRDFVSMPVQGLLRGPWGFVVGVTHGSASLLRNVTAGTVNSVTKLAASVARNLDRLTLDEEHFQRTEALRRSRPQGFAQGLSQGLTGFGISLLGAVGGLARHTLEAKSPVEIVTGVGKGIVGAFAKPLSGAAELVALTGQGMLHTVGFNAMPKQKFPSISRNTAVHSADCKIMKLLPSKILNDQILFFHEATLVSGDQLKKTIIILTNSILAVLDIEKAEMFQTHPVEKIEASFDDNDKTLINLHIPINIDSEMEEEMSFTNQRIINYLRSSDRLSRSSFDDLTETEKYINRRKLVSSFYMNEQLGQHLLNYLKIIKTQDKSVKKPIFSL